MRPPRPSPGIPAAGPHRPALRGSRDAPASPATDAVGGGFRGCQVGREPCSDTGRGLAVTERTSYLRHLRVSVCVIEEPGGLLIDVVRIGADKPGCPCLDGLRTLGCFAQHEDRFA